MTFHVAWTYVISFLDFFGISIFIPLLSGHLKSLGASHFFIGVLSSVYAGCQLLSGPIIGSLSDRLGRQNILIFCLIITSVCYFFMGITQSLFLILILRATLGIFKHIQSLMRTVIADHIFMKEQTVIFGRINAIAGISFTLGPAIGGHFVEFENGFFYICLFTASIFIINIAIAYFYLEDPPKKVDKSEKVDTKEIIQLSSVIKNIPKNLIGAINDLINIDWNLYWDIFLVKFLTSVAKDCYVNNYSMKVRERFQVSPQLIGYSLSLQGFSAALSGLSMGYVNKLLNKNKIDFEKHSVKIHIFVTLCYLAILLATKVEIFVFFGMLLAFANVILRVREAEILFKRCPDSERGCLTGMGTSITNIARMLTPLIVGMIEDIYGAGSGIILGLIISTVVVLVSINANRRKIVMMKND